jgi:hypothetical protein
MRSRRTGGGKSRPPLLPASGKTPAQATAQAPLSHFPTPHAPSTTQRSGPCDPGSPPAQRVVTSHAESQDRMDHRAGLQRRVHEDLTGRRKILEHLISSTFHSSILGKTTAYHSTCSYVTALDRKTCTPRQPSRSFFRSLLGARVLARLMSMGPGLPSGGVVIGAHAAVMA